MRLAVLHARMSPYFASCLEELKQQDCDMLLHAYPSESNAPFANEEFEELGIIFDRCESTQNEIEQRILNFNPDAILVSGWFDKSYLKLCRKFRKSGILVIAGCDTQWTGSPRQYIAGLAAPFLLNPAIDILWISGSSQRRLAEHLGYRGDFCWEGLYSCDHELFAREWAASGKKKGSSPHFLFVGRYVEEKGIDTLLAAYERYLDQTENPWGLVCAGAGPGADLIARSKAIDIGFIQPSELPSRMVAANAFILPSRFEPWGVVLHEAASSGLPLICTKACGAGYHLIEHKKNGYMIPTGDVESLATAMLELQRKTSDEISQMGNLSFDLSKQYTPKKWANKLLDGIRRNKTQQMM